MLSFLCFNPIYLIIFLLLNLSSFAQEKAGADFSADFVDALNYLLSLKSNGEIAEVSSEIIINKDAGSFRLMEGVLYPCPDYKGIKCALFFIGKGEFSFTPTNEIERKQLYRFYETENFQMDFKELFLLFDDSTYDEIISNLTLQKTKTESIDDDIEEFVKYFKGSDEGGSRSDFLRSIMLEGRNGFFYSQIQESDYDPVFFQISPFEDEEVFFMKRKLGSVTLGSDKIREIINQLPAQRNTLEIYPGKKPNKYFLDLISYKIESTILENLDFSAKCILEFESKEDKQEWIMFYLYEELIVDSVRWDDGGTVRFVHSKKSWELWIKCKRDYLDGKLHSLTIFYHGELLEKDELGWIYLKSSIYWYPRYDSRERAAFGLIFHTPAKYDLVSVGEFINKVEKDDMLTTTWFCKNPTRNVSFNIGKFERHEVKRDNLPTVNVYISEYGHQKVSSYFIQYGIYSMSDASEYIAQDISSSMELFTELFGSPPINSINVAEIPYLHGEAFPGLIHLSWSTVIQTDFKGQDEIFRAHEAAHQWWGVGLDFTSYHDQWLSEGLAHYSGLWYLQAAKNDNELFFDILNEWKNEILNVRDYIIGSGQEAGPIWLGYRTSSSNTEGDYDLIIYKKGAWILHMLRAMLLDLNNMNEDRIKMMMRDFFNTYKNKYASTEDFKKIVDKHVGEDMSWFFNQYVYGTDIPLYKVAYKSEKTDDDKNKISIRIRQEEVPESFKMYVPVKLVLDNDKFGRFRIEVKGKEIIYTTPPIEGELDELIFNDLESVLCRVEYEDW